MPADAHPANAETPRGDALCSRCGLCCTGTVVGHATLLPDEGDVAERLRLRVFRKPDGGTAFSLPCDHYAGDGCAVYEQRPLVCRHYTCRLLATYERGEIGYQASAELIDKAKSLIDRIVAAIGPAHSDLGTFRRIEKYLEERGGDSERFRRENAELLMDVAELRALSRNHFEV